MIFLCSPLERIINSTLEYLRLISIKFVKPNFLFVQHILSEIEPEVLFQITSGGSQLPSFNAVASDPGVSGRNSSIQREDSRHHSRAVLTQYFSIVRFQDFSVLHQ